VFDPAGISGLVQYLWVRRGAYSEWPALITNYAEIKTLGYLIICRLLMKEGFIKLGPEKGIFLLVPKFEISFRTLFQFI
jgi:hypothetical protein